MGLETTDPRIGTVIDNRYRIFKRLAKGSTGVVYSAQRMQLDRPVAIKFLDVSAAKKMEFRKRFEIEAKAMSRLSHPNCVSVIDFGLTDAPYIVMDLVRGHTLKTLTDRGGVEPSRAVRIIRQLLSGLAHAHNKGIIHCDIKPGNIMLSEVTGTGDFVRVFDFGMAKLLGPEQNLEKEDDLVAGTLAYMSPETLSNQQLDARTDIFSAGVVLYELLTGHKPFTAKTPAQILKMHDTTPLPLGKALVTTYCSQELEDVVARAMARDRSDRFQTATEFADALDSVPEAAGPPFGRISLPALEDENEVQDRENSSSANTQRKRKLIWAIVILFGGLFALTAYFALSMLSGLMGDMSLFHNRQLSEIASRLDFGDF